MKKTAKKMSVFQMTMLVAANMMGAGIIMLPTKLAQVGTISILSWLITALGSLALAHIFAQCGMFSNKPGGMGGYAEYAFGRSGHFMANYAYAISLVIANVAIAISAIGYGATLFGLSLTPVQIALSTIVLLWVAAVLNFGGSHKTGMISNVTVWGSVLPILFLSVFGWFWFDFEMYRSAWNPNEAPFFEAVSESIALTLWAFLGMESAAANMDAVDNPKKNVPIATFFGTLGVAIIYVLSTNIMAGIVPNVDLLNSNAPFALVFSYMMNETIGKIVMGTMVISCCGALLCWQFTLARVFKSSADVGFFPKVFAHVNSADAPVKGSFILLGMQSCLALMTMDESLYQQFENLVNLAVVTNILPYLLCCISVRTLLKEHGVSLKARRGVYVIATLAFIYSLYAIYATGTDAIIGGVVAILFGWVMYQVMFGGYRVRSLSLKKENI